MKPSKKAKSLNFAIAADNYKNEVLALRKYASYKSRCRVIDRVVAHFGYRTVQSITKQDIQRYIVKVSQESGVETLRQHLGMFKGIMEYADEDWNMPTRLRKPKAPRPKQEFYTFEEVRKLLNHSSGQTKVLIMLLAETGLRLGEALALMPEDIKDGVLSVTKNVYEGVLQDTPKTDSSIRKIHISKTLENALRPLKKKGFLFQSPTGRAAWPQQLTGELRTVCKNAGVEYKAFHSFRRGNITEILLSLGMPERVAGHRVGHLSSHSLLLGTYCKEKEGCDKIWVTRIEKLLYEGKGGYEEKFGSVLDNKHSE
jgi:integrase